MEAVIITPDSLEISLQQLSTKLAIPETSYLWDRAIALLDQAALIGGHKGVYLSVNIDEHGEDHVAADGLRIKSRILDEQTSNSTSIFPFLATCGQPLEDWAQSFTSITDQLVAGIVTELACKQVLSLILKAVEARHNFAKASMINPGSLADWPIEGQVQIFELLREPALELGVSLLDSFVMSPLKSMSGILFFGKSPHENCSHCPREFCSDRRLHI